MTELTFTITILAIVIVLGIAVPMLLFGSWVYQDAKRWDFDNDWLTPKVWVAIVLLTNYLGLIVYLLLRGSFAKKTPCPECGYLNCTDANFCNQCGEPLDPEPNKTKANKYGRLVGGVVSLVLTIVLLIGVSVWFVSTDGLETYSYTKGLNIGVVKHGGFGDTRGKRFVSISGGEDVFHFTTKEEPSLKYQLEAKEGEINMTIEDMAGEVVYEGTSPSSGTLSKELQAKTKYKVILTIEHAKDGQYEFDWR